PKGRSRILSLTIYVLMGWTALAALFPLMRELGTAGFIWLAIGGAFYTVGIVFYVLGKRLALLNSTWPHGVWHLFVIAGSAAHYFVILHYVL
ncbi:MAG: hemolysin III family protein, partial [Burkholderiaceae bacterium]|nr:hemolysin III family protein [Burkholderiaceae bacterium]